MIEEVFLVRCPSRINWEGHHVDHQGGCYNATTESHEMVVACSARDDDWIVAHNVNSRQFPSCRFRISDTDKPVDGWGTFLHGTYKALSEHYQDAKISGMNLVVGSDISLGGGMSSSHALLVALTLSAVATSGLSLDKNDAVQLVHKADWYAGARTGLGDQATMIFGKKGMLFHSPVGKFDEIEPTYIPLPERYSLVLIDSFTHHTLAGDEAIAYNARVFACKIALPLLLRALEEEGLADLGKITCPAGVSPKNVPLEMIYRALRRIPENAKLDLLREDYRAAKPLCPSAPEFDDLVETYFPAGHRPEDIPLRGVLIYTLAECRRSVLYAEKLEQGDIEGAGRLANVGHDGDRVAEKNPGTGEYISSEHSVSDADIDRLLADLSSGNSERSEQAKLEYQKGDYRASITLLDQIVDIARDCGAVSASLTGGGHGGVVTAMIAADRLDLLARTVREFYANELSLTEEQMESGLRPCVTVAGAGYVTP